MENNLLEVGKIINTHGLRGDVKVAVWMDYPEDFEEISYVYIKTRTELKKLTVKNVKYQKNKESEYYKMGKNHFADYE